MTNWQAIYFPAQCLGKGKIENFKIIYVFKNGLAFGKRTAGFCLVMRHVLAGLGRQGIPSIYISLNVNGLKSIT